MSAAALQQFQKVLSEAKHTVILTGAGVSAESGIPTFRGAGGLWRRFEATQLATPEAFRRDPSLVWEFYHYRREVVSQCRPNPAHYAIAALERRMAEKGRRLTLLTQNIDRLHQAAGSRNVVELHGSLWDVCRASRTGHRDPSKRPWEDRRQPLVPALQGKGEASLQTAAADIPRDQLPHDEEGYLLRPGVVWFNENLDEGVLSRAAEAMADCDLFITAGTSAVVYPAAGFAQEVFARDVPVVEFNLETSGSTHICKFAFQGKAGELLPVAFQVQQDLKAL